MKKVLCVLLVGIMLIGLAACNKSPATTQSVDNLDVEKRSPVTTPIENETVEIEMSEAPTEEPIESISQQLSYSIYVPNDNADGFDVETISTEDISAETVLAELKNHNVLPDAVSINSFNIDNGCGKV